MNGANCCILRKLNVKTMAVFLHVNVFNWQEIHQVAIQSLAEMTSCATEHWRRVGQQLLIVEPTVASSLENAATELSTLENIVIIYREKTF